MEKYESRIYVEGNLSKHTHIVYGQLAPSFGVLLFMVTAFAGQTGDVLWICERKKKLLKALREGE